MTCYVRIFLTFPLGFKYLSLLAQRSFHKQTKLSETNRGFVIFFHACGFCLKNTSLEAEDQHCCAQLSTS